jgi:hypothetical protein
VSSDQARSDSARFRVFASLFALATVLYHRWGWFELSWSTLPLVAATLVILKPSSTWRLLALVALQTLFAYRDLPGANTNRTLMLFLSATILCAWRPSGARWVRTFAPALRLQLLVVYAWACWHKLNTDFFDIEKSCGVALYLKVAANTSFLPWPSGPGALTGVVIGTVVVEALIPLTLVFRRARVLGLLLSAGLHFGCGLTMFYDFSMTMMAVLFLFTPPDFARELVEDPRLSVRARLGLSARQWSWLTALGALLLIAVTRELFWSMFKPFRYAWWGLPLPLGFLTWRLLRQRHEWPSARDLLRPEPLLLLFPLALFVNGLSPYIGWKTETSFAMYSNLRTEGGRTNHLLLSRPLYLFEYQSKLVRIESSSDPELTELAGKGYLVPVYVLRERLAELAAEGARGVALTYTRDGERVVVHAAEADPELARAPSYLERKLLRFREILPRDANVCAH